MSTPFPSSARGTPSLSVPSTQNTAPVIKFRCLYTHDLRRKAKRWQDGYLRYHTFNKRVMVYDTPGNFIGDLHWRNDDEIQDGDELELDKGVLIQVGECMEKTETDLSGLFEKRKGSQASPPQSKDPLSQTAAPRFSTPVRSSMSSSSQAARSLKDLLGIRKTPIGRAIIPKSPYEERHPQASQAATTPGAERPAKRQKMLPLEERLHEKSTNAPIRSQPVVIDLSKDSTDVPLRKPPTVQPAFDPPVRPRKAPEPTTSASTTAKPGILPHSSSSATTPPMPSNTSKTTQFQRSEKARDAPSKDSTSASSAPILPPTPAQNPTQLTRPEKPQEPSRSAPSAPINALRISTDKPRRKLMYRALLPGQNVTKPPVPTKTSNQPASSEQVNAHEVEVEIVPSITPPLTNADFMPSDSTQFILDEIVDYAAPRRHENLSCSAEDRKPVPKSSETASSALKISQPGAAATALSTIPWHSETVPTNRPAPATHNPIVARQNRTLARSYSTVVPALPAPSAQSETTRPQEKVLLRKTISDPTALATASGVRSRRAPPVDRNGAQSQGPWTAEALDLFDFWPPGRPKPNPKPC